MGAYKETAGTTALRDRYRRKISGTLGTLCNPIRVALYSVFELSPPTLHQSGMRTRTLIRALLIGTLVFGTSTFLSLLRLRQSEGRLDGFAVEGASNLEKDVEVRFVRWNEG